MRIKSWLIELNKNLITFVSFVDCFSKMKNPNFNLNLQSQNIHKKLNVCLENNTSKLKSKLSAIFFSYSMIIMRLTFILKNIVFHYLSILMGFSWLLINMVGWVRMWFIYFWWTLWNFMIWKLYGIFIMAHAKS